MTAILVIEDDAATADEIRQELQRLGFEVEWAASGPAGLAAALARHWDALVVDRMLPALDGLSLIQQLREQGVGTPALVLSALGDVADRITGLRAGGDDYLVKPFALGELAARLDAIIRRPVAMAHTILQTGRVELNLVTRQASRAGRELDLLAREFQLLAYMMRRPGQIVTRQMLLEDVFGYRFELKTNLVDVHMGRLRRKLDAPGEDALLTTVRGVGFCLNAGT